MSTLEPGVEVKFADPTLEDDPAHVGLPQVRARRSLLLSAHAFALAFHHRLSPDG